jgi:hypothetical protein
MADNLPVTPGSGATIAALLLANGALAQQIKTGTTPTVSLNAAASAPATGAVAPLRAGCNKSAMQVSFTGGSPTVVVNLKGSIDGTNYFTLATFNTSGNASGDIVTSSTPVAYLRADLATLSGGSSPTVTATLLAN